MHHAAFPSIWGSRADDPIVAGVLLVSPFSSGGYSRNETFLSAAPYAKLLAGADIRFILDDV